MGEQSHSYYDFQNIINTSNKSANDRIDLIEVYFKQVLKDNTEFRKNLKELKERLDESDSYVDWYFKIPFYKLIWYKLCNKNIWEIYLKQKEYGSI